MSGYRLVALLFVHEGSEALTGLVKQIDAQLAERNSAGQNAVKLGVFIVVLDPRAEVKKKLENWIAREQLEHVVVCQSTDAARYGVAREADLTVVVYERGRVAATLSRRFADLDEDGNEKIVQALAKVLPRK